VLRAGAMSFGVYSREIGSYISFFPALREMMSQHGLTSDDILLKVPRICYTNLDTSEAAGQAESSTVLVMEELSSQGFRMQDKRQGCTKKEAMMTLAALANYHALSHTWLKKFKNQDGSYSVPSSVEYLLKPINLRNIIESVLAINVPIFTRMLQHHGHHELAAWLEEQMKSAGDLFALNDASHCGPLVSICHGDCWINNLLFHFNDAGDADDVRIVDWQVTHIENPGRDIYNFLTTSTTPEVRQECGQLLEHYATTFMSALKKLGVSLEDEGINQQLIISELKKRMLLGMFAGLAWLPLMIDQSMASAVDDLGKNEKVDRVPTEVEESNVTVFTEAHASLTLDIVLANQPLCHRIIGLVREFKMMFLTDN